MELQGNATAGPAFPDTSLQKAPRNPRIFRCSRLPVNNATGGRLYKAIQVFQQAASSIPDIFEKLPAIWKKSSAVHYMLFFANARPAVEPGKFVELSRQRPIDLVRYIKEAGYKPEKIR